VQWTGALGRGRVAGQSVIGGVQILDLHLAEGSGALADLTQLVQGLLPHHGGGGDVHDEQQPGLAAPVHAQHGLDEAGLGGTVSGATLVQGASCRGAHRGAVALENAQSALDGKGFGQRGRGGDLDLPHLGGARLGARTAYEEPGVVALGSLLLG